VAKISDWDSHIGRRLKLRDLHVFFTVVQHGSIAKAASHLGVSHPAVSQLVAELEHTLGARLLERSSRGVTPTIYGRALLPRGRAAFDELKQGIREIEFLSDPDVGEVKIGCPEGAEAILLPVIEAFSRRYPRVVLDIHVEELETLAAKLRDRSLDFVVQLLRGAPQANDPFFEDFDVEVLFEDEMVIAAGAKSRWARRRTVDLADLVDEPWILTAPPSWNHGIVLDAFRGRQLKMPNVVLRTFSTYIRTNLVASGRFIATFPKSVAHFYADRFSLKVLPVDLPARPWPVAILTLKARILNPVVEHFIAYVRDLTRSRSGHAAPQNAHANRKAQRPRRVDRKHDR
jgi:DNA-binding transcriptional LysR family regulator